jgi:hypothetical protein
MESASLTAMEWDRPRDVEARKAAAASAATLRRGRVSVCVGAGVCGCVCVWVWVWVWVQDAHLVSGHHSSIACIQEIPLKFSHAHS